MKQKKSWLDSLGEMNPALFFLLVFLFQLLLTFQGLDLTDEGFNSVFYHEIFRAPQTVQYNFMFWLSGVVGAAFEKVFPFLGVWGFRLLGVLTCTATIWLTYRLLKNYLNPAYLRLGLILGVLLLNNNIKIFHYNYLSAFFYVLTVILLLKGLQKQRYLPFFLAGAVVALDTFARLPSLLNLGLILLIFYYGYLYKTSLSLQFKTAGLVLTGFIVTIAGTLLVMKLRGQLPYYLHSLKLLASMGSEGKESHYGAAKLIIDFLFNYSLGITCMIFLALVILLSQATVGFLRQQSFYQKWMSALPALAVVLVVAAGLLSGKLSQDRTLLLFSGFCLAIGLLIICTQQNRDMKVLALAGCFTLLCFPFASSSSIYTAGFYAFWIALPVAVHYVFSAKEVSGGWRVLGDQLSEYKVYLGQPALSRVRNFGLAIALITCLYHIYYYPFHDRGNRLSMHYPIHNKHLRFIYTTPARAAVVNELLAESAKYIKPGDDVLAYHSFPMYHYITETRPFLYNPMPWLYAGDLFRSELQSVAAEKKKLPVIVAQRRKISVEASTWPDPPQVIDQNWEKSNETRDKALAEFLQQHHYREAWQNEVFKIYVPPAN